MNDSRLLKLDRNFNDARMAAKDIAGTLETFAILYGDLAIQGSGEAESNKRLSATFSIIHARAEQLLTLLEDGLS